MGSGSLHRPEGGMDGVLKHAYGRNVGWMGSVSLHMAVRWDRWGLLAYIWK